MTQRKVDILFLSFIFVAFIAFVLGFHFFNSKKESAIPEAIGSFSDWGISSCDVGKGYVYVSGWAAPKDAFKLKTRVFLKDKTSNNMYEIKTLMYQRGHETEEMKSHRYFDNSGFVSGRRFGLKGNPPGDEIVILSLGRDGNWYRGDYVCHK